MARKRTVFVASVVAGLLAAGAAAFVIMASTANAVTLPPRIVQERTITLAANRQGTYTHTIMDEWRGHVLTVWLIPSGDDCSFGVPYAWYTTDTGDRYKYVLQNHSPRTCTARVQIVAAAPIYDPVHTGILQPGQTSHPIYLGDSNESRVWLAGIRTTTVGCSLELERVWYGRRPGESRTFNFTIRNRGNVACAGEALIARFDNAEKIATKKPGGNPTDYYTQMPGAPERVIVLGYSPSAGQTCTVGTHPMDGGLYVQRPFSQRADWTSWAVAPSSTQCEFSTYAARVT